MEPTDPISGYCWQGDSATVMARVVDKSGTAVKQAGLTSIARTLYDLSTSTPKTAIATSTLTISGVVYDAVQLNDAWEPDLIGFNFRDVIASGVLTEGGHTYLALYEFTYADTAVGSMAVVIQAKSPYVS